MKNYTKKFPLVVESMKVISIQHEKEKENSRTAIATKLFETKIYQKKDVNEKTPFRIFLAAYFTKKKKFSDTKLITVE